MVRAYPIHADARTSVNVHRDHVYDADDHQNDE